MDITEEMVEAATRAIHDLDCDTPECTGQLSIEGRYGRWARAAAEALVPLIAAQETARIEAADSPLCDCPRLEEPPQHLHTKAPMAHHCDCAAVTTAAAMLGSDRATRHAAECVCGDRP